MISSTVEGWGEPAAQPGQLHCYQTENRKLPKHINRGKY